MKSLTELQETLSGLQDGIDTCVTFLAQLTGGRRPKQVARAKLNGDGLRAQVKEKWAEHKRGRLVGIESSPPSGDNVTVAQAAKMLKMSEANVRLKIKAGHLRAMKEERSVARAGDRAAFRHHIMVIPRHDVFVLANGEQLTADAAPVRKKKKIPPSKQLKPGQSWSDKKREERQRTADLLAHFDTSEARPMPPGARPMRAGVLIQHNYLRTAKKGPDGEPRYLRTAKTFEP